MNKLRIATRSSPLALWQARFVAERLRRRYRGLEISLVPRTASGDRDTRTPLYGMEGIGVFAKEVHEAVLADEADIAVHSLKDLPTATPPGIAAPICLKRHDPRDALIGATSLADLPQGAVIGTSSLRRRAQLAAHRPDLTFTVLRGNVQRRLEAVHSGKVDATLLACAGLRRLGLRVGTGLHVEDELIPAAAQGCIAIDHLADRTDLHYLTGALHHHASAVAVMLERAVLARFEGGCSLPLGCYVRRDGNQWHAVAALGEQIGDNLTINSPHLVRRARACGPASVIVEDIVSQLQA